jgi:hypothetical protein
MLNLDKETLNFLEDHISRMLRSCPKIFGIFLYHGMGVGAGWVNELLKEGYYILQRWNARQDHAESSLIISKLELITSDRVKYHRIIQNEPSPLGDLATSTLELEKCGLCNSVKYYINLGLWFGKVDSWYRYNELRKIRKQIVFHIMDEHPWNIICKF